MLLRENVPKPGNGDALDSESEQAITIACILSDRVLIQDDSDEAWNAINEDKIQASWTIRKRRVQRYIRSVSNVVV